MQQDMKVDTKGSAIAGIHLKPELTYRDIPNLLARYIDDGDEDAWEEIDEKINYLYANVDYMLQRLNSETGFCRILIEELQSKKLVFKPNMVSADVIDPITHHAGPGAPICTQWPMVAAIMRWFHDFMGIPFGKMAVAEASTTTSAFAYKYSKMTGKLVTTEAVMEGKCGDFYGGWGFYFVRKYLCRCMPRCTGENPMDGFKESMNEIFIAPGDTDDKLMVYDLNKIQDNVSKGRTVVVPNGANFSEITVHKVIVGGDPEDIFDRKKYPGCFLVNVPIVKMHAQDLITNAIKNLGIGLYPNLCANSKKRNATDWKYASPDIEVPNLKAKLPHSPMMFEMDPKTMRPRRDAKGRYLTKRTEGFSGTQSDMIAAVMGAGTKMLHISDAINIMNLSHNPDGLSEKVPEGYLFASLDCVALDTFISRYCFQMVPVDKMEQVKYNNHLQTEFIQKVPIPVVKGNNIETEDGYDSPLERYHLYDCASQRGIGRTDYYVIGRDQITNTPLVSRNGHLGRIKNGVFQELITKKMYFNHSTFLHDLQQTSLHYAKANDQLTNSNFYRELLDAFDENKDGVIDYDEKGRGYENAQFDIIANSYARRLNGGSDYLKGSFLEMSFFLKYYNKNYNAFGDDFLAEKAYVTWINLAYQMSLQPVRKQDLFYPSMTYGKGFWPSLKTVQYLQLMIALYGKRDKEHFSLDSLYGIAFQYADKTKNDGFFTGTTDVTASDRNAIRRYFRAIEDGEEPLSFTLYVLRGFGSIEDFEIPNVKETDNPALLFTADFHESWD